MTSRVSPDGDPKLSAVGGSMGLLAARLEPGTQHGIQVVVDSAEAARADLHIQELPPPGSYDS